MVHKKLPLPSIAIETLPTLPPRIRQPFKRARKSRDFEPITIPSVGQQSFAGSVTQGGETHVGLGALDGNFVFGATLAGFDATPDNVTNLVGLARAQNAAVDAAAGQ